MTDRIYTDFALKDQDARALVDEVGSKVDSVERYRQVMISIGQKLAESIVPSFAESKANDICVVCTVEDADFLARGVINTLSAAGMESRVKLLCLWNAKVREDDVSLSPILRQYKEQATSKKVDYIIVKSIISGACVVKTNITRALSSRNHDHVYVVAPVLAEGAQKRLEREFPVEIAEQFKYIWLATDSKREGDNVVPGIGGSVYENLGLGNEDEKNLHIPEIVKERRKSSAASVMMT